MNMADIAVFHPSLMTGGGGEAVCAHTVAALSRDHDITIYSTDKINLDELSEFHGVDLHTPNIKCVEVIPDINRLIDHISNIVSSIAYETNLEFLRKALAQARLPEYNASAHDIFVSTWNELFISEPVVQYIHFPTYHQRIQKEYDPRSSDTTFRLYYRLCSQIARTFGRFDPQTSTRTLANSSWTADLVRQAYGLNPDVLYPPVHVDEFNPQPWDKKESGFVAIGRIHPLKRQIEMIKAIDALRDRGVETHIHIIGPTGDESYYDRVSALAGEREYVHVHGRIPRSELVDLVGKHRYGIHAREFEHFGIAVAELIAGDTIPFVPDSGGQTDIVKNHPLLTYENISEAVDNMESIITNPDLQAELRSELAESTTRYSSSSFEDDIRTIVEEELE